MTKLVPGANDFAMLQPLQWNTRYEVEITARNVKGLSEPTFYQFFMPQKPDITGKSMIVLWWAFFMKHFYIHPLSLNLPSSIKWLMPFESPPREYVWSCCVKLGVICATTWSDSVSDNKSKRARCSSGDKASTQNVAALLSGQMRLLSEEKLESVLLLQWISSGMIVEWR